MSPALDAVVLHAMRRHPENRYASAEEIVADLDHLDSLDPTTYDLSPEPPIGGLAAAADSARRLWILVAGIALGFLALVAAIIGLTVVLR